MKKKRRMGREDSATRMLLVDAAEQLLIEAGFGAVTSRKIAERVGLTHQSVFYYFGSLDDLFIALIRRNGEAFRKRLGAALKEETPLRALWNIACDRQSAVIELELKAMAVHNEKIRKSLTESLEDYRGIAIEHLSRSLTHRAAGQSILPSALTMIIESVGRHLVLDESLAITKGHDQVVAIIEQAIEWFERS